MKKIPLLQGKGLLIELPEGAENTSISDSDYFDKVITSNQHLTWNIDNGMLDGVSLPPGNWHIVGMLSEVTESDASGLVEEQSQENDNSLPEHKRRWWKNYTGGVPFPESRALESLESAISAEGYYLDENPHGEEPKPENTPNYAYSIDVRIWESAQSRVLDRSRCLLLGRDDEN